MALLESQNINVFNGKFQWGVLIGFEEQVNIDGFLLNLQHKANRLCNLINKKTIKL